MTEELFEFAEEDETLARSSGGRCLLPSWKVLVVDDEPSIHQITSLLFNRFEFRQRRVQLYHAYSASEAMQLIQKEKDFAVILLDVVMETEFAGLDLVDYIRLVLKNYLVKIIMRTGQPGNMTAEQVQRDYQVDYFRLKTDLTAENMLLTVKSALSDYQCSHTV
jgi:DNA-binding NtrC family response regulator